MESTSHSPDTVSLIYSYYYLNGSVQIDYVPMIVLAPDWRRARTMVQKGLTKEACSSHMPLLQAEAAQLMFDFLKDPEVHFRTS